MGLSAKIDEFFMHAGFDIEAQQSRLRGNDQRRVINPASSRDIFVKLPMAAFRIQFLFENIEPKQLLAHRVPQWPFAKRAYRIVEYHDVAAS